MYHLIKKYILFLLLFATFTGNALHAEDEEEEIRQIQAELTEIFSSEEGRELKEFTTSKLSADIWKEVERRAAQEPWAAMHAIERIYEIHGEYEMLMEYRPKHGQMFLDYNRKELSTQILGGKIEALVEKNGENIETKRLKQQLMSDVKKLFDMKLEMQKFELQALENEVKTLREMLDKRSKNRDQIVERRFNELTGVRDELEW